MASIGITWHMHDQDLATAAATSEGGGRLCIHEGNPWAYPDLNIYLRDFTTARLAAAAINGKLGQLLEDLYEFCDDLGDGAPDSPPYAHRALNLAARLDEILPKAPTPTERADLLPANEGGGL